MVRGKKLKDLDGQEEDLNSLAFEKKLNVVINFEAPVAKALYNPYINSFIHIHYVDFCNEEMTYVLEI